MSFFRVWLPYTCSNQAPQTPVYVRAPRVRADIETFVFGNQTEVSEADLRFIALSRDLKTDCRVLPLAFVFRKIEIVVQNTPDGFPAGNEFGDFDPAAMDVFVMIRELAAESIGTAINFL